jgi:hypothetical protein
MVVRQDFMEQKQMNRKSPATNSTYPKGGISCSKDSFVINQTLVFQIKFCGIVTPLG